MRKILLILILIQSFLFAQDKQEIVASFQKKLEGNISDTTRVRYLTQLSYYSRVYDTELSEQSANEALNISLRTSAPYYISLALVQKAHQALVDAEYKQGQYFAKKALDVLPADTIDFIKNPYDINKQLGKVYNVMGQSYDYQGMFTQAILYYLKAKNAFEIINHTDGLGTVNNNLGISYLYLGELDEAANCFSNSYEIYMDRGDTSIACQAKMNVGITYYYKGKLDTAITYYKEALYVMEKTGNIRSMGHAISNIGETYADLGMYDSALHYSNRGIQIDRQLNDKEGLGTDYGMRGRIFLLKGDLDSSEWYYKLALSIAEELDLKKTLSTNLKRLSEIKQKQGEFEQALDYYIKHSAYKDSIEMVNNEKSLGKIEAESEFNKKLAIQRAKNEAELKTEAEKRKRQAVILYFTMGIVAVILFFVYMLIKSLRETRKQKELVHEAKIEIEQKNDELLDSITYAKRIQTAILPPDEKVCKYLPNNFVLYLPKDIVAGDFYWLESLNTSAAANNTIPPPLGEPEGDVLFAAADCTGHGVPGAMVSVVCNNALNRSVREFGLRDPGEILNKTRALVLQEFQAAVGSKDEVKDGMDIALCSLSFESSNSDARLDRTSNPVKSSKAKLKYSGANNSLWIIRKGANTVEEVKADKQPIGQFDNATDFKTHHLELQTGDTIYIFSDGYLDQFGGDKGKKLKSGNFKKLLLSIAELPMNEQKLQLLEAFEEWRGNLEQLDDVCVIGVRI